MYVDECTCIQARTIHNNDKACHIMMQQPHNADNIDIYYRQTLNKSLSHIIAECGGELLCATAFARDPAAVATNPEFIPCIFSYPLGSVVTF
jgi:hypothetical protein